MQFLVHSILNAVGLFLYTSCFCWCVMHNNNNNNNNNDNDMQWQCLVITMFLFDDLQLPRVVAIRFEVARLRGHATVRGVYLPLDAKHEKSIV